MPSRFRRLGFVLCLVVDACGSTKPSGSPTPTPDPATCGAASATTPSSFAVQFGELTGTVTKNGQVWTPPPRVTLIGRDGRPTDVQPLWNAATNADGTFSARVPLGTYDVQLYDADNNLFRRVVPAGIQVQGTMHVAIDFQTVVVSGVARLAGAPFPTEEGGPGSVCFVGTAGDISRACAVLPEGEDAAFSVEVPRGYNLDVSWTRGGRVASSVLPGRIPFGTQRLGVRSFDADSTIDLNVDAPTLVVSGRVTVSGGPLPLAASGPSAEISLGPVTVTIADESVATFQVRLLAGTYPPMVSVAALDVVLSHWTGCFDSGCALDADTDWMIDISTAEPPRGAIDGTIDFSLPPGHTIVPVSGGVGTVTLKLMSLAASTHVIPFHGVQTSYTARVDDRFHFRTGSLPYGTYAVRFDGADLPSVPVGVFPFAGTVVVDRDVVNWRQAVALVPVIVDVKVNGQPMASDSKLDDEPRGVLFFSRDGDTAYTLRLGESGPARFERLMLPGRYRVAVDSHTFSGRTYLRGYEQDVLPIGRLDLGYVDIGGDGAPGGPEPVRLGFDLPVRDVSVNIEGAPLLTTGTTPFVFVRLISEAGEPFWTAYSPDVQSVPLRLYSGCYSVHVFPSTAPFYPDSSRYPGEARVGSLCTCDRTDGTPDTGGG